MDTGKLEGRQTFVQGRIPSHWLIEQMPEVIWATDAALRFVTAGGAAARALGLEPDRTVRTNIYEYFQTSDPSFPPLAAHLRALQGESGSYEFTHGGRFYIVRVAPIRHAIGRVVGVVACATDVTDVAATVRAESERAALRTLPLAVVRVDAELRVTFANAVAQQVLGLATTEGAVFGEPPEIPAELVQAARRTIDAGETSSLDIFHPGSDGRTKFRWHVAAEFRADQAARAAFMVGVDFTGAASAIEGLDRRRWLEDWSEATAQLASRPHVTDIAHTLLEQACVLTGAKHGGVRFWTAEYDQLLAHSDRGLWERVSWDRVPAGAPPPWGEVEWLEVASGAGAELLGIPPGRFRQALVVTAGSDAVRVALSVAWDQEDSQPAEVDAGVLARLARLAAAVASLHVRLDRAHSRQVALEAAQDFAVTLGQARRVRDVHVLAAAEAAGQLQADHAALALLDPEGDSFTLSDVHGPLAHLSGASFPVVGLYAQVIASGEPLRIDSPQDDPAFPDGSGLAHTLIVPVRGDGTVWGALSVARRAGGRDGPFDDADLRRLETLARLAANAIAQAQITANLEQAYVDAVLALARAMDAHDAAGSGHGSAVAHWAEVIARRLGASDEEVRDIRWAALLHNVGKAGLPEAVVRKTGPLSPGEVAVLRQYPVIGAEMLRPTPGLRRAAKLVRHHQERWDGTGYPDGLHGEKIPLGSRIIAVADTYNAIAEHHRYEPTRAHADAVSELQRGAGVQFDPHVVEVFLDVLAFTHPSGLPLRPPIAVPPSPGIEAKHVQRKGTPTHGIVSRVWRIMALIAVVVVTAVGAGRETIRPPQVRVVGAPGTFELHVNGRPFYIRGVAFSINEGLDDPREVLTPQRLRFHFTRIRQMGANTIRRYGERDDPAAIRDTKMVLDEAHRAGLKVLLGFWLGQDVDYVRDQAQLNIYRQRIRQWVLRHKDHPAVLMWVIGNEVWGLLKKEFPDPKDLWPQRTAYYRFVNEIAAMIHTLDGTRPVMSVDEHVPDDPPHYGIKWSMEMFTQLAPAIDIFGINAHMREDISVLQDIVRAVGLRTPYVVAEFGPPGYWLPHRVLDEIGQPVEPSDFDKARAFLHNWRRYIEPYRGWNLGGSAFVWKDKHEGSFTWFGLTDSADRLKPGYWALREAWTGRLPPPHWPLVMELSINKRWMRPGESFVVDTRLVPMRDPEAYLYTYLIAPVSMAYVQTQFTTDLPRVALHAPGVPGVYRVYVYVKTRDNRLVSTGSTTFAVHETRAPAP